MFTLSIAFTSLKTRACVGVSVVAVLALVGCTSDESGPVSAANSQLQVESDDDGTAEPTPPPVMSRPLMKTSEGDDGASVGGDSGTAADIVSGVPTTSPNGNPSVGIAPPPSIAQEEIGSLEVPDGTPEEMMEFVKQCVTRMQQLDESMQKQIQQGGVSREAYFAQLRPILTAQLTGLDKALAGNPTEEIRVQALQSKFETMSVLAQMATQGPAGATDKMREQVTTFSAQLAADKNPTIQALGRQTLYAMQLGSVDPKSEQEVASLITDAKQLLALEGRGPDIYTLIASNTAQLLTSIDKQDDAVMLQEAVVEAFKDHKDETIRVEAKNLEAHIAYVKAGFFDLLTASLKNEAGAIEKLIALAQSTLNVPDPPQTQIGHVKNAAEQMEITQHYQEAAALSKIVGDAGKKLKDEKVASVIAGWAEMAQKRLGLVGKPLIVEGETVEGTAFDVSKYKGKVVLLDFWATWCGPCIQEMPNLKKNLDQYADQGFAVIGVNIDQDKSQLLQFLQRSPVPWETIRSEKLRDSCGVEKIPFIVLIDRNGVVVDLNLRGDALGLKLAEMLGRPAATPSNDQNSVKPASGQSSYIPATSGSKKYVMTAFPVPDDVADARGEGDDAAKPDESNPYLAPASYKTAELIDFIFDMQDKPVSIRRRDGFTMAIAEASDRVLKAGASDKFETIAILAKFQALHEKASLDDEEADAVLVRFVNEMANDKRTRVAAEVEFLQLERQAIECDALKSGEIPRLLAQLHSFFAEEDLTARHLRIASSTVTVINRIEKPEEREKHFQEFGKIFAKSDDRALARYGKKLAKKPSSVGGSELVGKPLELAGTTALGVEFDWKSYRGRVVLVDFWATWCGPCRKQMPHVKALYEELKDQGFEVVGISLDEDQDALAGYLEENEIPWTNLAGEDTQQLATKYSVRGIPTMMLVDQDGKILAVTHSVAKLAGQARAALKKGEE